MKTLVAALALLLFAWRVSAVPVTYYFSQGGFGENAAVTGSFNGEDLDGDGVIGPWEYSGLNATFSGNATIPAQTWEREHLLFFNLATGWLYLWMEDFFDPTTTGDYETGSSPSDPVQGVISREHGDLIQIYTSERVLVWTPDGSVGFALAGALGLMVAAHGFRRRGCCRNAVRGRSARAG